jgi:hypothetical protein
MSKSNRAVLGIALPLAMTALVAGCGGSSGSSSKSNSDSEKPSSTHVASTTTTKTPSNANLIARGPSEISFIAKADAICRRTHERVAAVGKVTSPTTIKRLGPAIISEEKQGISSLRTLTPPSSLSTDWQTMLSDLDRLTVDANKIVIAVKINRNAAAQQAFMDSGQVQSKLSQTATKDGFKDCATT